MAINFIRASIIYVFLLLIIRLMGKRQIGEMQPFEFIVTIVIADLVCIPMSDVSIPLLYGVSATLAVFIIHQFLTLLDKAGNGFKGVLSGKPSVVINKNGVDFNELKKNNLDVSDLIENMRILGYFSLDSVCYAIYEANGNLSAVEKENPDFEPNVPYAIIKHGKLDKNNYLRLDLEEGRLNSLLNENGIKSVKDVGVFTVDGNGRYYLQAYKKPYVTGYLGFKEKKW
ncbi:MAG: DUF421 domain-containing protein [Clostridia bacterium]|nr:DUF421 domain-containing protein [Clostridia bacterium]